MTDSTIAEALGADDPQEIGSFHIIGLLGVGGMGEVYLGASDKGYAAVKRVRPRLVAGERFEREVGILYRVPPGVGPRVLASDSTAERPWFATEYVPGLTVDEAVRLRGPLPTEALWLLLAEAATHLSAVHASEIAHRDIKPGNVMLVRDGVQLIDFGIARAADQARLTKSGGSYGTQGFSAPEQQAGDENVGTPADVYSLGALVLYAASGRTPGVIPDVEPLRAVDADLADVIGSCLATGPGDRPTAAEVAQAARAHLHVPPPSWPSGVTSRIDSRRAFASTPVSKLETVPPPDPEATPTPEAAPASTALPHRPRTRRLLLPAAAVLALGAVAAFVLVPSGSRHDGAARPSADETVAGATRTPAASPSRSASPSEKSGHPTSTTPAGKAGKANAALPSASSARPPSHSAPAATSSPAAPPRITSSSISGVNGSDDPAQVKGSEADTSWVGNNATCSAWLDDNGSGELAGVLNTSMNQSCGAALHRNDGIAYTFHASWGAAKTNFISDVGHTMWICVWNASDRSDEQCSAHFAMNGNTPVKE
ncbi:serine/threonine protein kinase [Streptomyces sp. NBC_00006]|uniref:serine/threonine protein kinase n=1 Tax=Streptomyces sp. NBC_00006 TaxID=2975619 RepID=UPI00225B45E8|nr:serine/threonine-protein kinase [Streptomyces sp. NBC_00006]MCX5535242.1 serine/threonine protein kinase [Streptomyces sp. NBC_00006]